MNLKQFHIFFIAISILCTLGFAAWVLLAMGELMSVWGKLGGAFSGVLGIALIFYGVWFIRKTKHFVT